MQVCLSYQRLVHAHYLQVQASGLLWQTNCSVVHVQEDLLQRCFLRTNCLLGQANGLLPPPNCWVVHMNHARRMRWMVGLPIRCLLNSAAVLSERGREHTAVQRGGRWAAGPD